MDIGHRRSVQNREKALFAAARRRRSSHREREREREREKVQVGLERRIGGGRAGRFCKQGSAAMVQPKEGLSLLKFIPKAMRPSTSDVSSVALWGTTAAVGALWLVQPFDWIKAQISGSPAEDEQK